MTWAEVIHLFFSATTMGTLAFIGRQFGKNRKSGVARDSKVDGLSTNIKLLHECVDGMRDEVREMKTDIKLMQGDVAQLWRAVK